MLAEARTTTRRIDTIPDREQYTVATATPGTYLLVRRPGRPLLILLKAPDSRVFDLFTMRETRAYEDWRAAPISYAEALKCVPRNRQAIHRLHALVMRPFPDMHSARICRLGDDHTVVQIHEDDRGNIKQGSWIQVRERENAPWQTVEITEVGALGYFHANRTRATRCNAS
jgi:hypothetical protein